MRFCVQAPPCAAPRRRGIPRRHPNPSFTGGLAAPLPNIPACIPIVYCEYTCPPLTKAIYCMNILSPHRSMYFYIIAK